MESIKFIKLLLIFFVAVSSQYVFAEKYQNSKISNDTNSIVNKIVEINMVTSKAIYSDGLLSEQYVNFEELVKIASLSELKELLNHPHPVVRIYSFWTIANNYNVNLLEIIKQHFSDTTAVKTQWGCISSRDTVGNFFIDIAIWSKKLSVEQLDQLDSFLINSDVDFRSRNEALERVDKIESQYLRIRDLVKNEQNGSALVALAKYKKEQDIDLILNFKGNRLFNNDSRDWVYIFKAISHFHHDDFIPFLIDRLNESFKDKTQIHSMKLKYLYLAIAGYKNKDLVPILSRAFYIKEKDHKVSQRMPFLFFSLINNRDAIYDELLLKLWSEYDLISPEIFNYLLRKYPNRSIEISKATLNRIDDFHFAEYELSIYARISIEESLPLMLDAVEKDNRNDVIQIVGQNLIHAYVGYFGIYAFKAAQIKDSSFILPLITRLKIEDNAHVYLKIVNVLLAYKKPQINKTILKIRQENIAMTTGWGGRRLEEILKAKNLIPTDNI